MADTNSARQKITEKLKDAGSILVTVGRDPSVDELAAALGLSLMLDKLGKHATAVVSGAIPPAINFLEPAKTFENTVNSLRDFIIALDKEKADHLRYKVDGDVVKIFITPYKTEISEKDLEFSQGDYNVEMVIAIGVRDEEHLDEALTAHGKIFHDATVAVIDTEPGEITFGDIVWQDADASGICEMLVGLSESIKGGKTVLDEQTSTALLTGVVSATNRFSNERTSSKSMTIAAQLMAAGANQQLIATQLEEAHDIGQDDNDIPEETGVQVEESPDQTESTTESDGAIGGLSINHERTGDLDEVARQVGNEKSQQAADEAEHQLADLTAMQSGDGSASEAERKLAEQLQSTGDTPTLADLREDLASAGAELDDAAARVDEAGAGEANTDGELSAPLMGGTLNATSEQAHRDAESAAALDTNRTILSHDDARSYVDSLQMGEESTAMNASALGSDEPTVADPTTAPSVSGEMSRGVTLPPLSYEETGGAPEPTLAEIDQQNRMPVPSEAEQNGDTLGAAMPPMPDFSTLPPLPSQTNLPTVPAPDMGTISLPRPMDVPQPLPPLDVNNPAGAVPVDQLDEVFGAQLEVPADTMAQTPNDPGQFKIPGQG